MVQRIKLLRPEKQDAEGHLFQVWGYDLGQDIWNPCRSTRELVLGIVDELVNTDGTKLRVVAEINGGIEAL
jgi:hypothetical protein